MDAAFEQAVAPKPHVVLGVTLKELTIGHRFLMVKHGSKYFSNESPGIEDLILSVFICAHDWHKSERLMSGGWAFRFFIWAWVIRIKKLIIQIEYQKFHAYLSEGHASPRTYVEQESSGNVFGIKESTGSPYEWSALAMLIFEAGWSWDDALSIPIAKLNSLWAAYGEMKGSIKIMDNSRLDMLFEFARKMDAQLAGNNVMNS